MRKDVTRLVPGIALTGADPAHLTLADLLSQQSGLFDFTNLGSDPAVNTVSCAANSTPLGFVTSSLFGTNAFFQTPPHSLYAYSNTNHIVAGAGFEQATGAAYTDVVTSRVLAPLGMSRTFFLQAASSRTATTRPGSRMAPTAPRGTSRRTRTTAVGGARRRSRIVSAGAAGLTVDSPRFDASPIPLYQPALVAVSNRSFLLSLEGLLAEAYGPELTLTFVPGHGGKYDCS